jgi:hypothetical protein
LTGKTLESANRVGQRPEVTIADDAAAPPLGRLRIPALSVSIFEYRLGE